MVVHDAHDQFPQPSNTLRGCHGRNKSGSSLEVSRVSHQPLHIQGKGNFTTSSEMARSIQQSTPRSILRSATQSTNTTKRVTWADSPLLSSRISSPAVRRPPPSIVPPGRTKKRVVERREPTCGKRRQDERELRKRRRRADGVVKKRAERPRQVKKSNKKKGKKCKRGMVYTRMYIIGKCDIRETEALEFIDARVLHKIYAEIRRRLGKKVDQALRKRMVEEQMRMVEERKVVRKRRRSLEAFVNKMLPGVRAEAFNKAQLSRAAFAAVMARFERVQKRERASLR